MTEETPLKSGLEIRLETKTSLRYNNPSILILLHLTTFPGHLLCKIPLSSLSCLVLYLIRWIRPVGLHWAMY